MIPSNLDMYSSIEVYRKRNRVAGTYRQGILLKGNSFLITLNPVLNAGNITIRIFEVFNSEENLISTKIFSGTEIKQYKIVSFHNKLIFEIETDGITEFSIFAMLRSDSDQTNSIAIPELSHPAGPLGGNQVFTSAWYQTNGFQGITCLLSGDSGGSGTLQMQFSMDGINVARSIDVFISDLSDSNPRTLGIISSYFRIIYNNGALGLSNLQIQTIFHTQKVDLTGRLDQVLQGDEDILLGRSIIAGEDRDGVWRNIGVTHAGDFKTALHDPETGVPNVVTPAGALKISEISQLCGDAFGSGPLPSNTWEISQLNGATQLEAFGELVLATNGQINADVRVQTVSRARFYPGHFNTAHIAAQLSSVWTSNDTVAEWGAFDANDPVNGDGIFIRYKGGIFCIVTKRNGVENEVDETQFTEFIPAKTNLTTVYEIGFNAGTARFYQGTRVFHVESARSGPYVGTPHLRVGARLYNRNGSAENHDLRFRALGIYRVGRPYAVPSYQFITNAGATIVKQSPGTLHRILATKSGGGAATDQIILYDNIVAAGKIIAVIPLEANAHITHTFQVVFNIGLVVSLNSNNLDATIVFD